MSLPLPVYRDRPAFITHAEGIACPLCRSTEHMAPSQWGHPGVPLCHNPPCIYRRTLKVSAAVVPTYFAGQNALITLPRPSPVDRGRPEPPAPEPVPVELLLLAGGSRRSRNVIVLLSDLLPHGVNECMRVSDMPTLNALKVSMHRLRERMSGSGFCLQSIVVNSVLHSYQIVRGK